MDKAGKSNALEGGLERKIGGCGNSQNHPRFISVAGAESEQNARVADLIKRDQQWREQEAARQADERERRKKPGENDLQWRARLAIIDHNFSRSLGPLVPEEAEQHGEYIEAIIEHVDPRTGVATRAVTKRRKAPSSFLSLHHHGWINVEQLGWAAEIAEACEIFRRETSPKGGASIETRVDCGRGATDELIERMTAVLWQRTYSEWRDNLPAPRQMFVDMVQQDRGLFVIARTYRKGWPVARKQLIAALDRWPRVKEAIWKRIDRDDVERVYARLGEGRLA